MIETTTGTMIDLAFPLQGDAPARTHRRALAHALGHALPWLAAQDDCAVHPLNLGAQDDGRLLMSHRTCLTLRLPRACQSAAAALAGAELQLGTVRLRVGPPRVRELLPHGTLYAPLVVTGHTDALAFLQCAQAALQALEIVGRPICGRPVSIEDDTLAGFSLMVDGLSTAASLRLLERGIGQHRRLGCGVFVPHRSAAAVGLRDREAA